MTWEQITTLVGVVGGVALGYLGYRRSRQVDKVSAQSGAANETRAGTAQLIDGFNLFADQVQEDNKEFRAALRECAAKVERLSAERDEALREVARFRRRFGELD